MFIYCQICNKEFGTYKSLSPHIQKLHKISTKNYYDIFLKKDKEDICNCGSQTSYLTIRSGYHSRCSYCAKEASKITCSKRLKDPNSTFKRGNRKGSKNINPYPLTEKVIKQRLNMSANAAKNYLTKRSNFNVKGKFKPLNPEKYKGNPTNIIYRSSYELNYMSKLDKAENVEKWNSEEFFLRYKNPINGNINRYFPDFWVKYKDGSEEIIEIKPDYQTKPPKTHFEKTKKTKRYLKEIMTYAINQAKWEAAEIYCKTKGIGWKILTEYELGIKNRKNNNGN